MIFRLNIFVKLKIFHNAFIFWTQDDVWVYQFKVDNGYITLKGNISAFKQDICNLKTPPWS